MLPLGQNEMSTTAAAITMIVVAIAYVGIIFLSRTYNHGGRDPVDPLYSVSQWKPNGWRLTSTCRVPASPGFCVIEGWTGAYQDATRWCNVTDHPCIDPNTGENVKGTAIPFIATCGSIPFCGWSQCKLTFSGTQTSSTQYLKVSSVTQQPLIGVPENEASLFYMERLSVGDKGLQSDQNGTIAQFYFIPDVQQATNLYILCYNNQATVPSQPNVNLTQLTIQAYNQGQFNLPTMFVLMEIMPTNVSSGLLQSPASGFVARKILAFSGSERTQNPSLDVLQAFNPHVQSALWKAALTYRLIGIFPKYGGFYGQPPDDFYSTIVNTWMTSPDLNVAQDALEMRLLAEGPPQHRPFYTWIG